MFSKPQVHKCQQKQRKHTAYDILWKFCLIPHMHVVTDMVRKANLVPSLRYQVNLHIRALTLLYNYEVHITQLELSRLQSTTTYFKMHDL